MAEFTMPEFLKNHSVEDIHNRMKDRLPPDIDMSEGGHAWNLTIVTALVAAELCEFILPEVIRVIFPEWAYGEFLDEHGRARGIIRRAAVAATGKIRVTGTPGAVIPVGTLFATAAVNAEPSVDYETVEERIIPASGVVEISIRCTQTGTIGNTGANTVVLTASRMTDISAVTNPEPITGGTEEETDEALAGRIADYDKSQGESFTGCIADYKRWAQAVPGVGEATILPAEDDSGLVTIVLSDANGKPATDELCLAVYHYIMKPNDPIARLAPINANLRVIPPETVSIGVEAIIELTEGATMEEVRREFAEKLSLYLPIALDEEEVKLTQVGAVLAGIPGVKDYKNLKIGVETGGEIIFATDNISLANNQLPDIEEDNIFFTVGAV